MCFLVCLPILYIKTKALFFIFLDKILKNNAFLWDFYVGSMSIIVNKGSLSIKIQKDDEEPIYENNGISVSNEFDVEINESGTYTVSVTGEKAKGSVSFTVVTNQ